MLSYWFFFLSGLIMLSSLFIQTGAASGGWTMYPPLNGMRNTAVNLGSGLGTDLWFFSMTLFIVSSLLGGLNYVATILNMRTKGMGMWKLPLPVWALMFTAILGILAFPPLLSAALLLEFDRIFDTSFYLSDIILGGNLQDYKGGSPILYQHLFWFLGHPEVYIIILPAMGIVSEILSVNSRKPVFGYRAMVYALGVIVLLGFLVWAHHMYMTGLNPFIGSIFVIFTLMIAVPSAVKVFNWLTTIWKGNLRLTPAMMFSLGFVSMFVSGGLTGIFLGNSAIDIPLHDTYFVVAHFHIVMGVAAFFAMFAGVYHWFPKMFGRFLNDTLGYIHFYGTIISAYAIFVPMHFMLSLPRRYYTYSNFQTFNIFEDVSKFISVFAIISFLLQILFVVNIIYSALKGRKMTEDNINPWQANSLEWTTPAEHLHGNWPGDIPEVHRWPYDYSTGYGDEDYRPQNLPLEEGEEAH
jgi:cytochrome c oxidase subunit 1